MIVYASQARFAWLTLDCGLHARVAELADALASGASARKGVRVQVPPRAHFVLGGDILLIRWSGLLFLKVCCERGQRVDVCDGDLAAGSLRDHARIAETSQSPTQRFRRGVQK